VGRLFRASTSGSTIRLSGELDLSSVGQLNEALAPIVSAGGAITLDVSELEFMDSSTLQAIYEAAKSLDGRGCVIIHDWKMEASGYGCSPSSPRSAISPIST
jgi:anti-anti-sigma factor